MRHLASVHARHHRDAHLHRCECGDNCSGTLGGDIVMRLFLAALAGGMLIAPPVRTALDGLVKSR
jgi:hypothetical protein